MLFAALLVAVAEVLLIASSSSIFNAWTSIIETIFGWAGVEGSVAREPWALSPDSAVRVPVVKLLALSPSSKEWSGIGYATLLAWFATSLFPERWIPLKYALRFLCVVQGIALFFLWWKPAAFAYGLDHFSRLQVNAAFVIMLLIPLFLGASFLLLEFQRRKKMFLLVATLGYFFVAVPVHVAVCSVFVHLFSLATLPVFYLAFGPLLYSAWFVAFYSWGMSWKTSSGGMSWKTSSGGMSWKTSSGGMSRQVARPR